MAKYDSNSPEGLKKLFDSLPLEIQEHSLRVSKISKFLFDKCIFEELYQDDFELSLENQEYIEEASKYHDIGKAFLDNQVFMKKDLSEEDLDYIKGHTTNVGNYINDEFLLNCDKPGLYSLISDITLFHHERWDGMGYPNEYFGESIPICARIVAIADRLDHLMYPQITDKFSKLEFMYAVDALANESMRAFDPLLTSLLVKYANELQTLLNLTFNKVFDKKQERKEKKLEKKKAKEENKKAKIKSKQATHEEIPKDEVLQKEIQKQRNGPPIIFDLLPAYSLEDKSAKLISLNLILNDTLLGKITKKDYYPIMEKTNKSLRLDELEINKISKCVEFINKREIDCDVDMYVFTKNLKNSNYFNNFISILEKHPETNKKLCLSFDSYAFIDGDIDVNKLNKLRSLGIKIALEETESLYDISRLLSLYKIDYIKIPFKLVKGVSHSSQDKLAFDGVMKTISDYKVTPIIYEVDNYLEFEKCKSLKLNYLQGEYMGKTNKSLFYSLLKPTSASWISNE